MLSLIGPVAQFWLERSTDNREVGSSSLPRPTMIVETSAKINYGKSFRNIS